MSWTCPRRLSFPEWKGSVITNAEIMRRYKKVTLPWQEGRAAAPKKRILLVSPRYNTHIVAPHLGLGYLAASVRRAGHEVVVMDGLREEVKYDGQYDLVGISAMTTYFPEAVWETKRAKEIFERNGAEDIGTANEKELQSSRR